MDIFNLILMSRAKQVIHHKKAELRVIKNTKSN